MIVLLLAVVVGVTSAGPSTENYKDQFCTDPRTMKKHAAYTEWADAYSCTRHRCQPGGRNLAIYTVGCKRVEAPESAIECEEVVEDTNMQFPYCCTRLRCLVVVRGEVWTRVLGQPWETLPAAPWSHMYKMKKPPPGDNAFLPKTPGEGPIYELASDGENNDKVLRSGKKVPPEADCNNVDAPPRSVPTPDIVIALSTTNDMKEHKKTEALRERHKRNRKQQAPSPYFEDEAPDHRNEIEIDDPPPVETEKNPNESSDMSASPLPDILTSSSPNIPTNLSPDIPTSSSPDIPASPSPNIPANTSPNIPNMTQFVMPSNRKRITKTLPQHITNTIETLKSIKNQTTNSREIEDEFYHFGRNIASQLRQLPLLDALDVQSDILNLIKMKRQSNYSPSTNESLSEYYTFEIPEDDIIITQQNIPNQEETTARESNDVMENDVLDTHDTMLEKAIRRFYSNTRE